MAKQDVGTYSENFGEEFQDHVLAVSARSPSFILRYRTALDHTYFSSTLARTVSKALFASVDEHQQLPTRTTLLEDVRDLVSDEEFPDVSKYVTKLFKDDISDTRAVTHKIIDFGKTQAMINAVLDSAESIENGQRHKVLPAVREAMLVGEDLTDIGIHYSGSLEDRMAWYLEENDRDIIPTGISHLDYALGGGAMRGELYVMLAPPKRGKTTALINIGFGATISPVKLKVAHYSLEMSQKRVAKRYDDRLAGKMIQERGTDPNKYVEKLTARAKKFIVGDLYIKSYPTRTASVSNLRAHLSFLESRGFYPDVIIVDYADIMKAERRLGETRHEQAGIYEDLRTMAGEYDAVVWTGSQAKVGALEKETLDLGDFAESFEKAAIMDGGIAFCLPYNQGVITDQGSVKIGDMLKRMSEGTVRVLSHNFDTGKDEWKPIVHWFNNGDQPGGEFIRVRTEVSGPSKGTTTTPDHKYFRDTGYKVEARDLTVGSEVVANAYVLSDEQEQVLIGSLLGDGYLRKTFSFAEEHGSLQEAYLRWKIDSFGQEASGVSARVIVDDFGKRRTCQGWVGVTLAFRRARALWYPDGKKIVPDEVLDRLTPLGLAVWLMDDATISKRDGRVTIYCQGFDVESRQKMHSYLERVHGVSGAEYRGRFQIDTASSRKLLGVVSDYLVPCDAARQTKQFLFPSIAPGSFQAVPVKVTSVESVVLSKRVRYNIEVADNHNFYTAGRALVSNCQTLDEKANGECRLVCVGLRGAEDGRVIRCDIRRDQCRIRSTALLDAQGLPIPTTRDVDDDDDDMETKKKLYKAKKSSLSSKKLPFKKKKVFKANGKKVARKKKSMMPSKKVD